MYASGTIGYLRLIRDSTFVIPTQIVRLAKCSIVRHEYCLSACSVARVYGIIQYLNSTALIACVTPSAQHFNKVYTVTPLGSALLEANGFASASITSKAESLPPTSQIPHALKLVELRISLSPKVVYWLTDREVSNRRIANKVRFNKDYDAVAEFKTVNIVSQREHRTVVAFEYERTFKSAAEYGKIASNLRYESQNVRILYLVNSFELSPEMIASCDNQSQIAFAQIDELLQKHGLANVYRSIQGRQTRVLFDDFLCEFSGRTVVTTA